MILSVSTITFFSKYFSVRSILYSMIADAGLVKLKTKPEMLQI